MQSSIVIYWVSAVLIIAGCNRPSGVPFAADYDSNLQRYSLEEKIVDGVKSSSWDSSGRLIYVTVSSKDKFERLLYDEGFLAVKAVTNHAEGRIEEVHYDKNGEWVGRYTSTVDGERIKDVDKITITDDLYYVKIRDYTTGLEEEISYRNGKKQYSETRPIAPDEVRK